MTRRTRSWRFPDRGFRRLGGEKQARRIGHADRDALLLAAEELTGAVSAEAPDDADYDQLVVADDTYNRHDTLGSKRPSKIS